MPAHDALATGQEGDEEQEGIVTGHVGTARPAIEPVLATRPDDIVRNKIAGVVKVGFLFN